MTAPQRAEDAAEAIRALNHETIRFTTGYPPDGSALPDGYTWPSDVSATLAGLESLLQRLPQALMQAVRWLAMHEMEGLVGTDDASSASQRVRYVAEYLDSAHAQITGAAAALAIAHGHADHLTGKDPS